MIKKMFKSMAVAQIISAMTVLLCLMIDSIMIGRFLGVDAMAAYGLSNPLLLSFAAIGSMLSAGAQVLCSKAIGSGNKEETNSYYSIAVAVSVIVSLVGVVAVILFRGPISTLLGAGNSGEIYGLTKDYLLGFIVGAPAFLFATVLIPFMQLAGQQTRLVIAVVVMTVSDIIFDLLNVLVFHGGMLGMGIASSLSYYLAFIIGIGYFVKKDCIFKFSKKLVKLKSCKNMLKAGIPTIINMISTVLLSFTMNKILLGVSGSTAVAAYSVIGTVVNICYAFSGGLAGVALMLAGMYYCEEDRKSLKELLKVALRYAIIVDAIVTVIVFAVAPLLVRLFLTDNDLAIQMAAQGSRIFVLSLVISAINSALKHFYQGTGRIKITYVLCALQNYICIALSAFVLSRVVGLDGVWFGYLCGEIIVLMVIFAYIVANRHKFDFSMDTLSLLPDGYGVPDDDCLILNIKSEAEVVEASQAAGQYCRAHNKSSRLCMYTGLCIEEMCNNIITYGFDKTGKNTINIRIFCKEDELVIRFRDDCKAFDPVKYFEMHNESDDPAHHIGIRMIFKLVKDVNYTNSMSLNNLMMKI